MIRSTPRSTLFPYTTLFRSITGAKIFISAGEHDMVSNILHLVLARLPDAPAGSKGISLFLVPKYKVNADGSLAERNQIGRASCRERGKCSVGAVTLTNNSKQ